jgi:hypothetical protein
MEFDFKKLEKMDSDNDFCNGPFCGQKKCPNKIDYDNQTCKNCIKNADDALAELNRNHYH